MQYHVHIYFADETEPEAWSLRGQLESRPEVQALGRFHTKPVGPHPCRQFQLLTDQENLPSLIAWLEANRRGLNVLIHPVIDDDYEAHTTEASWLGTPQILRLEIFKD